MANGVCACCAGEQHEELLTAMLDDVVARGTDDFAPQALSNIIWACASLDHHRPDIMEVCAPSAEPDVPGSPKAVPR